MKVSIIGGGGRVGACAATALQFFADVGEIALVDVNRDMAEGEALDLIHGAALVSDQSIYAAGTETCRDADVICITAGLRRKPDESRLDLINRNVSLFKTILSDVASHGMKDSAVVFVVSNPVDILTYLAAEALPLPAGQVIGLGTALDSARFRGLIAHELSVPPTQVSAMMLGEHGDSMVALWSAAQIAGLPIHGWPGVSPQKLAEIETRTRKSGAEVISKKGGAGQAVGVAIADVIRSIARDDRRVLPVSSLQSGAYGIEGVCLSVPTIVGRSGALGHVEVDIAHDEADALRRSGEVLGKTLREVV